jgi:hypothetical protein
MTEPLAPHDWLGDSRPFSAVLLDWKKRHGWSRVRAASELMVPLSAWDHWAGRGRRCEREASLRLLMTLIDADLASAFQAATEQPAR